MAWCTCNVAAEFLKDQNLGLTSVILKTNANFSVTEGGLVMYGPTMGDLSITAYAPLKSGEHLTCPGRAQTSFNWTQKIDCDVNPMKVYFIPTGRSQASTDGDVTEKINMQTIGNGQPYDSIEAISANGPATASLVLVHMDGYDLTYTGSPIKVTIDSNKESTEIAFLKNILPDDSELYMNNFSWSYDPINIIPTVSYSFIFNYNVERS